MPNRKTLVAQLNQIYSAHRSALLNRKYYGHRLSNYQKMNRLAEILLVITTSSAVGSWAIWQIGLIRPIWSAIIAAAAVVSIVKPLLQWPQEIERCSKLRTGYSDLYEDLDRLVVDIAMKKNVTPTALTLFRAARDRARLLTPDDDPQPIERLRVKYTEEVNREKPLENYWRPPRINERKEVTS